MHETKKFCVAALDVIMESFIGVVGIASIVVVAVVVVLVVAMVVDILVLFAFLVVIL